MKLGTLLSLMALLSLTGCFAPAASKVEASAAPGSCKGGGSAVPCAGLELWLDAAVVPDGPVASWADKSPSPHTVTQSVAAAQPVAAASPGLNGHPLVSFDGVDDALDVDAGFDALTTDISIFAVVVPRDVMTGGQPIFYIAPDSTDKDYIGLFLDGEGWNITAADYGAGMLNVLTADQPAKLEGGATWGNGSVFRMCGMLEHHESIPGPTGSTRRTVNFVGGSVNDSPLNASVAEVLVYSRSLDNPERTQINSYLAQKWGVCP